MFFPILICAATVSLTFASPPPSFANSAVIDITPEDFEKVVSKNLPIRIQVDPKYMEELRKSVNDNDTDVLTANLNDFMEKFITNTDAYMKNSNYDPYELPNIKESVTYHILWLIPYTGSVKLSKGKLKGTSSIFRNGESIVSYNKTANHLDFKTNIGFNRLKFSYLYHLRIPLVITSRGICDGGVTDLDIDVAVGFDFNTGIISLDEFNMPTSGHISIAFHEFSTTPNWALNLILNAITAILKDYILEALTAAIKTPLESAIGALNTIIQAALSI